MSKCNYSGIQEIGFRSRNKGTGKAVWRLDGVVESPFRRWLLLLIAWEPVWKARLRPANGVVKPLKMLTYDQYAALFRGFPSCYRAWSRLFKQTLTQFSNFIWKKHKNPLRPCVSAGEKTYLAQRRREKSVKSLFYPFMMAVYSIIPIQKPRFLKHHGRILPEKKLKVFNFMWFYCWTRKCTGLSGAFYCWNSVSFPQNPSLCLIRA